MKLGEWELTSVMAGHFGLDGGAMFGVVPKTLWARFLPPDDRNRIPMVMRLLVARGHGRTVLVDAGAGPGYTEKEQMIYDFRDSDDLPGRLERAGVAPGEITDIVITHLHFDHGAGVVEPDGSGAWRLVFPNAVHHVHRAQWDHALAPNARDRASYYRERIEPMASDGKLELHDGPWTLCDGFDVEVFHGHTPGQQLPRISGGGETLFFGGDLVPTQHHIATPYIMAYDLDAVRAMDEKTPLVERAHDEGWILFFEHDAHLAACRLERREGRLRAGTPLDL